MADTRIEFAPGNGPGNGEIPPEEISKIRASAIGKEQAPSTREQSSFVNWREAADQLGQPFEVEKIPISKLRAMRRDPMLGFGLNFIKTPIVRAKWHINATSKNGPDARIAAHLDHDLRLIWASLVLADMNKLDFGFQAIAKRWLVRTPSATYIETDEDGEETEQPVWSEGTVQPLAWKPFIALQPEFVEPIWAGDGSFNGIDYMLGEKGNAPGGVVGTASGAGKSRSFKIDVYHALWSTNEREQNFGSLFGYPRLGYAYRYWWSYWFRWAIADRAFEKKADPSIIVRHPDIDIDLGNGDVIPAREYALMMGDRLRSGSTVALSSMPYLGETDGKPSSIREWDIEFLRDGVDFDPFDKSFDYLDVQKLRSLFIPEQAFLEGKGGTSSRNVAAELGESFVESQAVLAAQTVEAVNRWVIPQWVAVNYPEFLADGGKAEVKMSGFADQDVEFTKQIIQLVGQQEEGAREIAKLVDLKRVLEDAGTPIASFEEQQRRIAREAEAAAQQPPAIEPQPGGLGIVPTATGFAYTHGREVMHLADTGTAFIENLPPSPHYEDRAVKGFARQLWNTYHELYRDEYDRMLAALEEDDEIELTDENGVALAAEDFREAARRIVSRLPGSRLWVDVIRRTTEVFDNIARRAARRELSRAKLRAAFADDDWSDWRDKHLADVAGKVAETTRDELRDFIAARLDEGVTDRKEIARQARAHFSDFPDWKTDRLVRTEVRDVYNAATLLSGRAAGVETAQASDADSGDTDPECMERDGQLFSIDEALREREHPNGTLAWRLVPVTLSVERSDEIEWIEFDHESKVLTLSSDVTSATERRILKTLVADMLA